MRRRVSHLVDVGPLLEDLIVQRMRGAAAGLAYIAAIISHLQHESMFDLRQGAQTLVMLCTSAEHSQTKTPRRACHYLITSRLLDNIQRTCYHTSRFGLAAAG